MGTSLELMLGHGLMRDNSQLFSTASFSKVSRLQSYTSVPGLGDREGGLKAKEAGETRARVSARGSSYAGRVRFLRSVFCPPNCEIAALPGLMVVDSPMAMEDRDTD